jgi:drug/metabolite transporter (DMT)-like permease
MFKGAIFVFLGACSFGVLSTFMKLAVAHHHYAVKDIVSVQAFLGMIVLWIFHGVTAKRGAATIPVLEAAGTPAWKVMLAGISTGLSAYLYYSGVNLLPASVAIVILMNYTWMCLLIERLAFRKKPVRAQLISVALVLAGRLLPNLKVSRMQGKPEGSVPR